jgi:ATP-dependent DNA helicase DinG
VGRLLRSVDDRGVVAMLDSRLAKARYGGYLRASLPPFWETSDPDVVRKALTRLAGGTP